MKPKKWIRLLKREANKLPLETYTAAHKLLNIQFQDKDGNMYNEPAPEGEEKRKPVWRSIQEHPVNHGRRVKRYFKKYGMAAVDAYFYVKGGMVRQELIRKNKETPQ